MPLRYSASCTAWAWPTLPAGGAGSRGAKACSIAFSANTKHRGSEHYLYTLDPLAEVAVRLAHKKPRRYDFAVSADVGPDLIRPWRRPSMLILYADTAFDAADLDGVDAAATTPTSSSGCPPTGPSSRQTRSSGNSEAAASRLLSRIIERTADYRVIGGLMVTALACRWDLLMARLLSPA